MRLEPAAAVAGAEPALRAEEFAAAMAALGPWESKPRLAVAVSGGADSRALALLARDWAGAERGRLTAFIVDHGLRPEAAREASETLDWLARHGIGGTVLREDPPARAPESGLQEHARALRYRLLLGRCMEEAITHLLLAHHREDQVETVLLRLGQGSGLRGLAGMAGASLAPEACGRVRLVRPLLGVAKGRLRALLQTAGESWVEDPSNRDLRHARVRLRQLMPVLQAGGFDPAQIAASAARLGAERAALGSAAAAWLTQAAKLSHFGHVVLDLADYDTLDRAVAEEVLRRAIGAVGGAQYPPRLERLRRLSAELRSKPARVARTLGGCVLRCEGVRLTITREGSAIGPCVPARPGISLWDGRFELSLAAPAAALAEVRVRPLGTEGVRELRKRLARAGRRLPAAPARQIATIPALWRADRLLSVPHPPFAACFDQTLHTTVAWTPRQPLTD